MEVKLITGEPCAHFGCLNHVTHACEGCGRVSGYPKSMTIAEAKSALKAGHKIRHRYFTDDEWVACAGVGYIFEDGVMCDKDMFWKDRQGPGWEDGWSIVASARGGK